jgi:hypothetical protein
MSWLWQPLPAAQGAAGASVTLDGTGGALTLVGGTATLSYTADVSLTGTGGTLALAGGNATLSYTADVSLAATGGALTLTGADATLVIDQDVSLAGTGGALSLAGGTASTTLTLTASGGALALTGGTATLTPTANVWLEGTGGTLTLTGGEATLSAGGSVSLVATGGALVLIGGEAALTFTETVAGSTEEQPSGGYGWSNLYTLELRRLLRKKIKREEDEERLEAAIESLDAEIVLPNDRLQRLVAAFPATANRTQRAIEYAQRAKTDFAYELALRAIAKELEDEEHAVLMTLAML